MVRTAVDRGESEAFLRQPEDDEEEQKHDDHHQRERVRRLVERLAVHQDRAEEGRDREQHREQHPPVAARPDHHELDALRDALVHPFRHLPTGPESQAIGWMW